MFVFVCLSLNGLKLQSQNRIGKWVEKKKENGGVFETNESQVRIYTICTSKKEISDEGVGMWGHTGVITMNEEMFL